MKQALIDLFTSKKFLAALTAILVYVAGRFGLDIDPASLDHIFAALMVYVGAQGIADHGKEAALVRASAPVAVPSALYAGSGGNAASVTSVSIGGAS